MTLLFSLLRAVVCLVTIYCYCRKADKRQTLVAVFVLSKARIRIHPYVAYPAQHHIGPTQTVSRADSKVLHCVRC